MVDPGIDGSLAPSGRVWQDPWSRRVREMTAEATTQPAVERVATVAAAALALAAAGCGPAERPVETPRVDGPDDVESAPDPADDAPLEGPADDGYSVPPEKACETADDCVAVACDCKCSGCGGFYFEDVVNLEHEDQWYEERGCEKLHVCPEVCCPGNMTLACEQGRCVVVWNDVTVEELEQWTLGG
jgi:hypothetical protein